MASIVPGVLPSMALAVLPTAMPSSMTSLVPFLTATTLGSFRMIPRPRTHTSVLAVPRSMPMSIEKLPKTHSRGLRNEAMESAVVRRRGKGSGPRRPARRSARERSGAERTRRPLPGRSLAMQGARSSARARTGSRGLDLSVARRRCRPRSCPGSCRSGRARRGGRCRSGSRSRSRSRYRAHRRRSSRPRRRRPSWTWRRRGPAGRVRLGGCSSPWRVSWDLEVGRGRVAAPDGVHLVQDQGRAHALLDVLDADLALVLRAAVDVEDVADLDLVLLALVQDDELQVLLDVQHEGLDLRLGEDVRGLDVARLQGDLEARVDLLQLLRQGHLLALEVGDARLGVALPLLGVVLGEHRGVLLALGGVPGALGLVGALDGRVLLLAELLDGVVVVVQGRLDLGQVALHRVARALELLELGLQAIGLGLGGVALLTELPLLVGDRVQLDRPVVNFLLLGGQGLFAALLRGCQLGLVVLRVGEGVGRPAQEAGREEQVEDDEDLTDGAHVVELGCRGAGTSRSETGWGFVPPPGQGAKTLWAPPKAVKLAARRRCASCSELLAPNPPRGDGYPFARRRGCPGRRGRATAPRRSGPRRRRGSCSRSPAPERARSRLRTRPRRGRSPAHPGRGRARARPARGRG